MQCGHDSAFLFMNGFDLIFEKPNVDFSLDFFVTYVYKFMIIEKHYNTRSALFVNKNRACDNGGK